MKKAYLALILVVAVMFSSCENTNDDYDHDRGVTIGFSSLPLEEVALPPGGTLNFPVPFFITSVSTSDRTFNVSIVESATTLSADNYSFEPTVTVPANSRSGTLLFQATNNSMSPDDFQAVVISFESQEGITSGKTWLFSGKSTN